MNPRNPKIKALLSLQELYTLLSGVMEECGNDEGITLLSFGSLINDIVEYILPSTRSKDYTYLLTVMDIYLEGDAAKDLLDYFINTLTVQLEGVGIPKYPEVGHSYRYYTTGGLMLVVTYGPSQAEFNQALPETHLDILQAIERGDYVSERVKQQWGFN